MGVIKRGERGGSIQHNNGNTQSGLSTTPVQWEEVSTEFTTRVSATVVYGDTDTGRSTLALTAPGPIAYIHAYDEKVDGLVQRIKREGKDIKVVKFGGVIRGGIDHVQKLAEQEMSMLESAISDAYKWARSIVLDTESKTWELAQLARLGTLTHAERDKSDQRKGQLVYQEINNRYSALLGEYRVRLDDPLQQDKSTNLILICKTKDEYKKMTKGDGTTKTENTGRTIIAAQKNTCFFADVVLRTNRTKQAGEYRFSAVVEKPWWNEVMRGYEFEGDELNFCYMMGLLTDTDPDEWK